jgi:hypothetical protein
MHHIGTDRATGWVCAACYPAAIPPALIVTDLGAGLYLVNGGAEPHEVRLTTGGGSCDCADHQYRRRECKHIVAVRREARA